MPDWIWGGLQNRRRGFNSLPRVMSKKKKIDLSQCVCCPFREYFITKLCEEGQKALKEKKRKLGRVRLKARIK